MCKRFIPKLKPVGWSTFNQVFRMPCSAPQNLSQKFALPFGNNGNLNKVNGNLYWKIVKVDKHAKKIMLFFSRKWVILCKNILKTTEKKFFDKSFNIWE